MSYVRQIEVPLSSRLALTLPEIAAVLGVKLDDVCKMADRGLLHTHRIGRHRVATISAVARMLGVTREDLLGERSWPVTPVLPQRCAKSEEMVA